MKANKSNIWNFGSKIEEGRGEVLCHLSSSPPHYQYLGGKQSLDEFGARRVRAKYEQLNMIEEKRLSAICHSQLYQRRATRAFDRKVCPGEFEVENLILQKILPNPDDANGKWP
ncbi:hypothetical protein Lal_00035246 [Lupinus albus]|nr:hypothetical protein Lal_00035246 [Lupinus albus]